MGNHKQASVTCLGDIKRLQYYFLVKSAKKFDEKCQKPMY